MRIRQTSAKSGIDNRDRFSMTQVAQCRKRIWASCGIVAVGLYAPFSWLLLEDQNWSDYRLFWLYRAPILPGFVPGAVLFQPNEALMFTTMGITTFGLLVSLTWLAAKGQKRLLAAIVIALLVSAPSAWLAYRAYWD